MFQVKESSSLSLVDGSHLEQNCLMLQVEVDQEIVTSTNNDSISSSEMANTKQTNHKEAGKQGSPAVFPIKASQVVRQPNIFKHQLKMTIITL